jgi:hypothetical protein
MREREQRSFAERHDVASAQLIYCFDWWSQTESNRRPLQCHCYGKETILLSEVFWRLLKPLRNRELQFLMFSLVYLSFPFGGDMVATWSLNASPQDHEADG